MRKFDAVLLSALVLYDYSASTVVDKKYFNDPVRTTIEEISLFEPISFKPVDELLDVRELDEIVIVGKAKAASFVNAQQTLKKVTVSAAAEKTVFQPHITMPSAFEGLELEELELEQLELEEDVNISFSVPPPLDDDIPEAPAELDARWTNDILAEQNQFLDSDNDGVFDDVDQCPYVDGVARFDGCPVPDTDGDGVNDEEDHCPFLVGSADNNGCPDEAGVDTSIDNDDGGEDPPKKKGKKKSKLKALHF